MMHGLLYRPTMRPDDIHQVSLGNIFQGQTGCVWTKGVAVEVEFESSGMDEDGTLLPVKVSTQMCRHY